MQTTEEMFTKVIRFAREYPEIPIKALIEMATIKVEDLVAEVGQSEKEEHTKEEPKKRERGRKTREYDPKFNRGKSWWTKAEEDRMIALFEQGVSYRGISEIIKRSPNAIRMRLNKLTQGGNENE